MCGGLVVVPLGLIARARLPVLLFFRLQMGKEVSHRGQATRRSWCDAVPERGDSLAVRVLRSHHRLVYFNPVPVEALGRDCVTALSITQLGLHVD